MKIKAGLIASCALFLTACFPAKEITQENAENVLSAVSRTTQVSELAQKAVKESDEAQINNQSLVRYLVRSATNISTSCENEGGTVSLSISENESDFSMVFANCEGEDGGLVEGTVSGTMSIEDGTYALSMVGDLEAKQGSDKIVFNPINFDLTFTLSDTEIALFIEHGGTYVYDTRGFKGSVKVETITPVGFAFSNLTHTGEVTYTDEAGNVLLVEHDNNGVHLSFNGSHFKTFTHVQWNNKYN
jgi:hypothetical protein